jgi:hypothetical protein
MTPALRQIILKQRYRPNAVSFDGATYLTRGADLTGAADSKLWTVSVWVRVLAGDGVEGRILASATAVGGSTFRTRLAKLSVDRFGSAGFNAAAATILSGNAAVNDTMEVADGWVHCLVSVDMADASKRHVYINDVFDANFGTYTDDIIDFTLADWSIGADPDGSLPITASVADLWHAPGVYIDFSQPGNRRKFISAARRPVYLGENGEKPTGAAPIVFMSGPTANWHLNRGTGGAFAVTAGALTNALTNPAD